MTAAIDLAAQWLPAIKPPPKCLPSQFAERAIVLPQESNAVAGPVKLHPYQIGMCDAVAEQGVHTVVFMTGAQVGKSLALTAALSYYAVQEPSPQLFVSPTDGANAAFVKEKFNPLIAASPILKSTFGADGRVDSSSLKLYPGGFAAFASSYKPADLAARAIRVLIVDELDRFAISAGAEGNPLSLALKRTTTFLNKRILIASTPTSRLQSRIKDQFDRSDKREWHTACQSCGTIAPFTFDRLRWPEGEPHKALLACNDCGHELDERGRLDAVAKGEWIATATGEPGVVGFHCSQLISPLVSMEQIAREYDAADTPDKKRVFTNTVLGLPFDEASETDVDIPTLMDLAEQIAQPYPKEIGFVTCGIDIQSNRAEATLLAHLPRNQRVVLDHVVIPGDPSDDSLWSALDELLGRSIALADKRQLQIAATAIDAGFSTTRVAQFVASQRAKSRRVYATFGRAGFGRPVLKQGSKIARGLVHGNIIGVDDVKLSILKQLVLPRDAPNAIRFGVNLGETWAEQIAAERLTTTYKKGFAKAEFTKEPHARNEALDALTYAVAIASTVAKPPPATATAKPRLSIADLSRLLNQNEGNRNAA